MVHVRFLDILFIFQSRNYQLEIGQVYEELIITPNYTMRILARYYFIR